MGLNWLMAMLIVFTIVKRSVVIGSLGLKRQEWEIFSKTSKDQIYTKLIKTEIFGEDIYIFKDN